MTIIGPITSSFLRETNKRRFPAELYRRPMYYVASDVQEAFIMKNAIILDVDHGQSRFDCDWTPGLIATRARLRTA